MFRKTPQPSNPKQQANDASITETGPCQKSLRVHVGLDAIAPIRTLIIGEFQKRTTLPGFRKGKVPTDLVERQYAQPIQDETLHRVTKQTLEQAVKTYDLRPVGPFELHRADFDQQQGLMLEATVEVEPAFPLRDYKGMALKRPAADMTAHDVEQGLAQLQDSMAQLEPTPDGQSKERKVPALDDELAKDLGFKTLAELKEHLTAKFLEQKRQAQAQALEAALCDELLKRHVFEIPPTLVSHQTERLTRDFKARLLLSGKSETDAEEELKKFTEQLRRSAERNVKLAFIIERIADQESLSVSQDEIVARLWQLSQRWKKDPADVRKVFDAEGLWPSVVSAIRQEKTISFLLSAATIADEVGMAHG